MTSNAHLEADHFTGHGDAREQQPARQAQQQTHAQLLERQHHDPDQARIGRQLRRGSYKVKKVAMSPTLSQSSIRLTENDEIQ